MTTKPFKVGTWVWVQCPYGEPRTWWPARVVEISSIPKELDWYKIKIKNPFACVYYNSDDSYQLVTSKKKICEYNCAKKMEYVEQGYLFYINQQRLDKSEYNLDNFIEDVIYTEQKTGGNINIFNQITQKLESHKRRSVNITKHFITKKERKKTEKRALISKNKSKHPKCNEKYFNVRVNFNMKKLDENYIQQTKQATLMKNTAKKKKANPIKITKQYKNINKKRKLETLDNKVKESTLTKMFDKNEENKFNDNFEMSLASIHRIIFGTTYDKYNKSDENISPEISGSVPKSITQDDIHSEIEEDKNDMHIQIKNIKIDKKSNNDDEKCSNINNVQMKNDDSGVNVDLNDRSNANFPTSYLPESDMVKPSCKKLNLNDGIDEEDAEKKKWRNLTDKLNKEMKKVVNPESGAGQGGIEKYLGECSHRVPMMVLNNIPRNTLAVFTRDKESDNRDKIDPISVQTLNIDGSTQSSSDTQFTKIEPIVQIPISDIRTEKKKNKVNFEEELIPLENKKMSSSSKIDGKNDEDMQFLKSIYPYFVSMSQLKKLKVRMQIQAILLKELLTDTSNTNCE